MQSARMISRHALCVHTPWGIADHCREYAEGITFYGTPSHGGFKLSPERLAAMHPALRVPAGWFEEDCEWAKVAFAFPECFTPEQREAAIHTLKDWCPDAYEAATGETLAPGASYIKDQRLFHEKHAEDWIVISAISSDQHPGQVECIATIGGKRGEWGKADPEERRYLVPKAEYDKRGSHGFVINPALHAPYDGQSSFIARRASS
ncbi:hypothetical protein [Thalassospira sp.]|uniref:DUF7007 domain-containing protein n=1 Tax=Thalassospira sp. TaxID=1912094 RepID=UPI0032EE2DB6